MPGNVSYGVTGASSVEVFDSLDLHSATCGFRNAAIIGEMRNRFYVRERRPAQRQPFGLEDAATCFTQDRRWDRDVLQHVGLLIAKCAK